uniref:CARD domain-containing protein n=1 Tax=Astatotilapia calliptera TaxID=8154 RepID=A0A3P8RGI4_ASTCA
DIAVIFPSGQKHFVDAHEAELIQRVSNIEPILDELKGKIIQQEAYDKIRAQQTPQEKMRALYNGPLKAGDAAKEAFYQSLKKHEPMLIEDLS